MDEQFHAPVVPRDFRSRLAAFITLLLLFASLPSGGTTLTEREYAGKPRLDAPAAVRTAADRAD